MEKLILIAPPQKVGSPAVDRTLPLTTPLLTYTPATPTTANTTYRKPDCRVFPSSVFPEPSRCGSPRFHSVIWGLSHGSELGISLKHLPLRWCSSQSADRRLRLFFPWGFTKNLMFALPLLHCFGRRKCVTTIPAAGGDTWPRSRMNWAQD